jgi:hypothetical protein
MCITGIRILVETGKNSQWSPHRISCARRQQFVVLLHGAFSGFEQLTANKAGVGVNEG